MVFFPHPLLSYRKLHLAKQNSNKKMLINIFIFIGGQRRNPLIERADSGINCTSHTQEFTVYNESSKKLKSSR